MSKLELHVHLHHHHDGLERSLARLLDQSDQILKETKQMPNIDEVKAAIQTASDNAQQQIVDAVQAAVQAETAEVIAQIQAKPAAEITQADLDAMVASVSGIPTAVNTRLAASIGSISANDGLPEATSGSTGTPIPIDTGGASSGTT